MKANKLAILLHEWYLEATKELKPESYNPNAQKDYDKLTNEQKYIDIYIATKIIELFKLENTLKKMIQK